MTLDELHNELARTVLGPSPCDEDGLALVIVLHTHSMRLSRPCLSDMPGATTIRALTQRHACEVVASAWPDRADRQKTNSAVWYWDFNTRTPFEVVEDIEPSWRERVDRTRSVVLRHPEIAAVDPED